jgi:hypothetical protein
VNVMYWTLHHPGKQELCLNFDLMAHTQPASLRSVSSAGPTRLFRRKASRSTPAPRMSNFPIDPHVAGRTVDR